MAFRSRFGNQRNSSYSMTIVLLALTVLFYVLSWLPGSREWIGAFFPISSDTMYIWSPLTYFAAYAAAGPSVIFFLFHLVWLFFVGNAIEAMVGKMGVLWYYLVAVLIHGLFGLLASAILPPFHLMEPFLAISWLTVLYASRAPEQEIRFWGIIPVKLKWLAVLIAIIDIMMYGSPNPLHGLIVTSPLLLSWFYGRDMLPVKIGQVASRKAKRADNRRFDKFYGKVRDKSKERDERERLRKLFESSLNDDKDNQPG